MVRYFLVPGIIGTLVFLSLYFILPGFIPEPRLVSHVAGFLLDQSNLYFNPMPAILARYIAGLNLLVIALSGAILSVVFTGLAMALSGLFIWIIRRIILLFKRKPRTEKPADLAPIDLDPRIKKFAAGKKIMGKGFDTVDRV